MNAHPRRARHHPGDDRPPDRCEATWASAPDHRRHPKQRDLIPGLTIDPSTDIDCVDAYDVVQNDEVSGNDNDCHTSASTSSGSG